MSCEFYVNEAGSFYAIFFRNQKEKQRRDRDKNKKMAERSATFIVSFLKDEVDEKFIVEG